jgi:hypothetical protein
MQRRSGAITTAAIAMLALGGCASVQHAPPEQDAQAKRFVAPAGLSRLYIYRNELLGALVGLDVMVDDKQAGTTKGKTYVIADLPEGKHEVVSKGENTSTLTVQTRAGQPTFVWQEVKMGLFSPRSQLALVSDSTGRAGVSESDLVVSPLMQGAPAASASPAPAAVPAAAADVAVPAPAASPVPSSAPVVVGRDAFEAERAAKAQGCEGPGGVRPAATLSDSKAGIELYAVRCTSRTLAVQCELGMCRVLH